MRHLFSITFCELIFALYTLSPLIFYCFNISKLLYKFIFINSILTRAHSCIINHQLLRICFDTLSWYSNIIKTTAVIWFINDKPAKNLLCAFLKRHALRSYRQDHRPLNRNGAFQRTSNGVTVIVFSSSCEPISISLSLFYNKQCVWWYAIYQLILQITWC